MTKRHRITAATAVAGLVIAGAHFVGATSAYADDVTPSVPPGTEPSASAPPPIRPDSPGLKLPQGGILAPSKVLDMVEVVEDIGGEERREETNQTVMMALQSEVMFPEDSAVFNAQAAARIQAIAQEINSQKATTVRVFGFTDDQGS
ncbi:OmpA family protein, partial [Streptomyces sp. NPDC059956]